MDPELWPRRPRPESTGPHYESEVHHLAELRTVRAQLRAWVADGLEKSDAGGAVVDDLVAAIDELVSNGLRHGRAPVRVRASGPRSGCCSMSVTAIPTTGPSRPSAVTPHSAAWACAWLRM